MSDRLDLDAALRLATAFRALVDAEHEGYFWTFLSSPQLDPADRRRVWIAIVRRMEGSRVVHSKQFVRHSIGETIEDAGEYAASVTRPAPAEAVADSDEREAAPPLVAGGQGRTGREIVEAVKALAALGAIAAAAWWAWWAIAGRGA